MAERITNPRQNFYSIDDASEMLHVSSRTVQRWIKSGELSAFKIGRNVRISLAELEAFLRARRYGWASMSCNDLPCHVFPHNRESASLNFGFKFVGRVSRMSVPVPPRLPTSDRGVPTAKTSGGLSDVR